jgi:pyrimidine operon attenuation protein/uracil phosphoribosyltransferase
VTGGKTVLTREDIRRAVGRIAHEILERNRGLDGVVLVGMRTRGVPLAARLAAAIQEFEGQAVPVGALDIGLYRDDIPAMELHPQIKPTELPTDIHGKRVVLVDRGHRELPIRADYVGKNIPTALNEDVQVLLEETDGRDEVVVEPVLSDVEGPVLSDVEGPGEEER